MEMSRFDDLPVLIKGAGDLASGVAARLHRCGFPVFMTELPEPLMVRRSVCFGEAVYEGRVNVEEIFAQLAADVTEARRLQAAGIIPLLVDPGASSRTELQPAVLVDGIMAKHNTGTHPSHASLVIALGPGFVAGVDCHAVIETNRGHWLGRVIWQGGAEPDTAVPGSVGGKQRERVLRAPADGALEAAADIGDTVTEGQVVGRVAGADMRAGTTGVLRGLVRPGMRVTKGMKVGDIDPRAERAHCFSISEKSMAIGGGVLEAILSSKCRD